MMNKKPKQYNYILTQYITLKNHIFKMFMIMLNVYIYKIKIYPHERAGQILVLDKRQLFTVLALPI